MQNQLGDAGLQHYNCQSIDIQVCQKSLLPTQLPTNNMTSLVSIRILFTLTNLDPIAPYQFSFISALSYVSLYAHAHIQVRAYIHVRACTYTHTYTRAASFQFS